MNGRHPQGRRAAPEAEAEVTVASASEDVRTRLAQVSTACTDHPVKCCLCGCKLGNDPDDDEQALLCSSCAERPEAQRLLMGKAPQARTGSPRPPARDFTPAEKSLIRTVHGLMPATQLLALLNERLACDLGPDAAPYTLEQLYVETGQAIASTTADGGPADWTQLRRLIAQARVNGVLEQITSQVVDDFAVVFSLNARQVMKLKEILLPATEE